MTARTPSYLKSLFETGDQLTQGNFEDVFDSFLNLVVTGTQVVVSDVTFGNITASLVTASAATISDITAPRVSAANINVTNRLTQTVDTSVRATGSTQTSAKSISAVTNILTTVSAGSEDAVIIGGGYPGFIQYIINTTTNTAQVFPPSGGSFDGGSANAAKTLDPSGRMMIWHATSALFYTHRGV